MPTKVERLYQTQPRWMRRLVRCMLLLACVGPVAAACASLPSVEKDYAVGEAAEADGWRLTLHSLVLLPGDRWRQPDPGKVFCAVEVTLENLSRGIRYFMPERQMVLVDGAGKVFSLDHQAGVVSARTRGWTAPEGAFSAGTLAHGAVAYELPKDAQDLRWVFRSSLLPWAEHVTFWLGSCPAEP